MTAPLRGRWAQGLEPRFFCWIVRDRLAASERPGGFARSHRKIRRQEELIWLGQNGFTRVITLLDSPHNLQAYDDAGRLVHDLDLPADSYHMVTGVREHEGRVWLGSLEEPAVAVAEMPQPAARA